MIKYWVGVACKQHVLKGMTGGFCQLCHGKRAPLIKMQKGDKILYYAPKESINTNIPYQKIMAIGTITDDFVYSFKMTTDFIPFRRNVEYLTNVNEIPLKSLNEIPEWVSVRSKLRFGHFEISQSLYQSIYEKMVTP